jgi:hypothetical protein
MRRLICLLLALALPFPGLAALSAPVAAAVQVAQVAADDAQPPCHGDAAEQQTPDCCPDCDDCVSACGSPGALPSPESGLDELLNWHYDSLQTSADLLPPHRFVGLRPPITLPG